MNFGHFIFLVRLQVFLTTFDFLLRTTDVVTCLQIYNKFRIYDTKKTLPSNSDVQVSASIRAHFSSGLKMVIACTIDIQPAFSFQIVENVYSLMRNFFRHPQRFVQNFIFLGGGLCRDRRATL